MIDVFLAQHLRDVERDFPHDAKVISKAQGTAMLKNIRSKIQAGGGHWALLSSLLLLLLCGIYRGWLRFKG